jgi:autotransporter passenger strand-loop-strand repeat protein
MLFCCSGLNARCTEDVGKGIVVRNESVEDGEVQRVHHGGKAVGVIVKTGGKQIVCYGGKVVDTVVGDGGVQLVFRKGLAETTYVDHGGLQVLFGGTSRDTLLKSGSFQLLYGGFSFNTMILENKAFQVVCDGVAKKTILKCGGTQLIFYGGKAVGTWIRKDGCQVLSGSMASNTYIDGGKQVVCRNNIVKDTVIVNGGVQSFVDDNNLKIIYKFSVINYPLIKDISRNNYLVNVFVKDKGKVLVPQSYVSHGINFKNLKIDAGGKLEECDK